MRRCVPVKRTVNLASVFLISIWEKSNISPVYPGKNVGIFSVSPVCCQLYIYRNQKLPMVSLGTFFDTFFIQNGLFWKINLPVTSTLYFFLTFFNINYQHLYLIRWVSNLLSLWACRHFQMLFCSKVKKYEEQVKQKLKSTQRNINHVKYKGNQNSHKYFFPLSISFRKDVSFYEYK